MKILLCASSRDLSPPFVAMAEQVGAYIGKKQHTLVYGRGDFGLMGAVARAAAQNGAKVVGIIPAVFNSVSPNQPHPDVENHVVENLFIRKDKMLLGSDLVLAIPGGIGTLDEILEAAVANDVQCYADDTKPLKPIIILNAGYHFSSLERLLKDMVAAGAMDQERLKMFHFVRYVEDAIKWMEHYEQRGFPAVSTIKKQASSATSPLPAPVTP